MTLQYTDATHAFQSLLHRVMSTGDVVASRNGKTRELTMQQFTLNHPDDMSVVTPGRRVSLPAQIAETMWILAGRNDVDWISHYLPRAAEFSDDNKVWRGGYGPRLRAFRGAMDSNSSVGKVDQLAHIVDLLKADPETRRAVFTIYDPAIDNKPGKDIPCNNWVHFLPRNGELHAHVAIRSNDLFWGWSGINSFEWVALLQVVAGLTGLERGSITFSISSLHLYEHHWEKAEKILLENEGRGHTEFLPSPKFKFAGSLEELDALIAKWFHLEGQIRKGGISASLLHQLSTFPEPLMRSWLFVLMSWHHNDPGFVKAYEGTNLEQALHTSPKRKKPEPIQQKIDKDREKFTLFVNNLHQEKNAAYGNSWMKRGEMLGIMANCARKVDRLGVSGAGDTAADTAIDLLVYFIKYDLWLEQQKHADWHLTEGQAHIDAVYNYLEMLERERHISTSSNEELITEIKTMFDSLENLVTEKRADRDVAVKVLIAYTYPLAVRLWKREQNAEGASIDAWHKANEKRSFSYEQPALDVSL